MTLKKSRKEEFWSTDQLILGVENCKKLLAFEKMDFSQCATQINMVIKAKG